MNPPATISSVLHKPTRADDDPFRDETLSSMHDAASVDCYLRAAPESSIFPNHNNNDVVPKDPCCGTNCGHLFPPIDTVPRVLPPSHSEQNRGCKRPHYMFHPRDHSVLLDHRGDPLSIDRMLGSQPLQSELATRPGPNNKRLVYLKGDAVTRLLNQVFGYNGWNLTILKSERLVPPGGEVLPSGGGNTHKYHVAYLSHVRITLINNQHTSLQQPVFREDMGMGDATDRNFYQAASHALKSSITDGVKRAARHFGDRLGNSLYDSQHFSFATAPKTQQESLDDWEKRWNQKYGDRNATINHGGEKSSAANQPGGTGYKESINVGAAKDNQTNHPQPLPSMNKGRIMSHVAGIPNSVRSQLSESSSAHLKQQPTNPKLSASALSPIPANTDIHISAPTSAFSGASTNLGQGTAPNDSTMKTPASAATIYSGMVQSTYQQHPLSSEENGSYPFKQPHSVSYQRHLQPDPTGDSALTRGQQPPTKNDDCQSTIAPPKSNTASASHREATSNSRVDFYDETRRPTTSHGSNGYSSSNHRHTVTPVPPNVTATNYGAIDGSKRHSPHTAAVDMLPPDMKKFKPTTTTNPYGPRT